MEYTPAMAEVSIHAPHEGERRATEGSKPPLVGFQSTLPTRGSDKTDPSTDWTDDVSIHAPHEGERRIRPRLSLLIRAVSIHAPHEGERHYTWVPPPPEPDVSIHAPHEGERPPPNCIIETIQKVSIHAPHEGERLFCQVAASFYCAFQSTLPTRNGKLTTMFFGHRFQSTLPTRGSDKCARTDLHVCTV